MIKSLEVAIEKVKAFPEERQQYVAHVLEQIAAAGDAPYELSDHERRLVREGLADLDAGRIVTDDEMAAFWRRNKA
jgi:predicted transcriptional regulator